MSAATASVTPMQLELLLKEGVNCELVDVRTPGEYRSLHAEPATNLPLDQLRGEQLEQLVARAKRHTVYVICQSGGRGRTACQKLAEAGAEKLANVEGGTAAWEAAGLPIVRGHGAISLERQVRIGAGALVLLGVALALWVHPWWIGLSAFIAAGLIFSGVTGFCGMAIILAKMPWNRS